MCQMCRTFRPSRGQILVLYRPKIIGSVQGQDRREPNTCEPWELKDSRVNSSCEEKQLSVLLLLRLIQSLMIDYLINPILNRRISVRPSVLRPLSHSDHPPWIMKRGGLESSGWRLISAIGNTKRIAMFSEEKKILKKKSDFLKKSEFLKIFYIFGVLAIFDNFWILGVVYGFFFGFFGFFCFCFFGLFLVNFFYFRIL